MRRAAGQGEIWWAEAEDKRRPVLIVTRSDTVPVTWVMVAPVTRTIRGIPTEVVLGAAHGLRSECVASFDNLQPIRRSFLTERVGELGVDEQGEICRALRAFADC